MGLEAANLPGQNDRRAWPSMREQFASVFRTRTRDEWIALAAGRDACLAPVLSIDEAPEHPQMVGEWPLFAQSGHSIARGFERSR